MSSPLRIALGVAGGAVVGGLLAQFVGCEGGCPLMATWWRGALYGAVVGGVMSLSS